MNKLFGQFRKEFPSLLNYLVMNKDPSFKDHPKVINGCIRFAIRVILEKEANTPELPLE